MNQLARQQTELLYLTGVNPALADQAGVREGQRTTNRGVTRVGSEPRQVRD